ncbi:13537_t:CDS:2, partial [Cetraspora pellucida]
TAITKDEIKQKINSANTEGFLKMAILVDDEDDKLNGIFFFGNYVEDGLIRWSAMGHDTIGRLLGSIFNLGLTAIVEKEDERGVRIVEPNTNNNICASEFRINDEGKIEVSLDGEQTWIDINPAENLRSDVEKQQTSSSGSNIPRNQKEFYNNFKAAVTDNARQMELNAKEYFAPINAEDMLDVIDDLDRSFDFVVSAPNGSGYPHFLGSARILDLGKKEHAAFVQSFIHQLMEGNFKEVQDKIDEVLNQEQDTTEQIENKKNALQNIQNTYTADDATPYQKV